MKQAKARCIVAVASLAGLMQAGVAQAALFDRGSGMLYDSVLNITWLQDANYAKTSGYDADGRMNWSDASTWAANLSYGGFSDWRLATNTAVSGAAWEYSFSYGGNTDFGENITSPHSELSYMYYVNLDLKGDHNPNGSLQPNSGIRGNGTVGGQANIGLVQNLQGDNYWSEAVYAQYAGQTDQAWQFFFGNGTQTFRPKVNTMYAWAVRAGDVAAVPEPDTYAMLLAGLGLIGAMARWGKKLAT
jgi:hypothetical protein